MNRRAENYKMKTIPKKHRSLRIYVYPVLMLLCVSICVAILIISRSQCSRVQSEVNSTKTPYNPQENIEEASITTTFKDLDLLYKKDQSTSTTTEKRNKYESQFVPTSDEYSRKDTIEITTKLIPTTTKNAEATSTKTLFSNYYEFTTGETETRDNYETDMAQTTDEYYERNELNESIEITTIPISTTNSESTSTKPLSVDHYEFTTEETEKRDKYETLLVPTTDEYYEEGQTTTIPTSTKNAESTSTKPLSVDHYEFTTEETEKRDKYETLLVHTTDEYYEEGQTTTIPTSTKNAESTSTKPLSVDHYEFTTEETEKRDKYETLLVHTTDEYYEEGQTTTIPTSTKNAESTSTKPLSVDHYEFTTEETEKRDKYETLLVHTTDEYYEEGQTTTIPTSTKNAESTSTKPLSVDHYEFTTEETEKRDKYETRLVHTTDEYYDEKSLFREEDNIETTIIPISTTNAGSATTKPLNVDHYEFTTEETEKRNKYITLLAHTTVGYYDEKSLSTEKDEITTIPINTTTTTKPKFKKYIRGDKRNKYRALNVQKTDENYDTKSLLPEDTIVDNSKEYSEETSEFLRVVQDITENIQFDTTDSTKRFKRSNNDSTEYNDDKFTIDNSFSENIIQEYTNYTLLENSESLEEENNWTELQTTEKDYLTIKHQDNITSIEIETEDSDNNSRIKTTESPDNQKVVEECNANCRQIGARLLSQINHDADPCESFYNYTCGGDNIDNIPEDHWRRIADEMDKVNSESSDSYKTYKRFYESCVDFHSNYDYDARVAEAKHILSMVKPYDASVDERSSLTELLTRLLQLESSPLFDISVDVEKDSHFIFQLNVGKSFSTPDNSKRKCLYQSKKTVSSSISNSMNLDELYKVYSNCQQNETYNSNTVQKALEVFQLDGALNSSIDHIEEILEIFKDLPSVATMRKNMVMKKYIMRKVSLLELFYPLIHWKQLLTNLVGRQVDEEDVVQDYFPDVFFKLFSRKQNLTIPQLYNAILAMFAHDLYTNLVLPTSMANPEEYCLQHSSNLMKEVASSLYLKSINLKEVQGDIDRVTHLFSKMKNKLKEMLEKLEWANVNDLISMKRKLNYMELITSDQSLIWKNITLIQQRMNSVNRSFGNYSDFTAALVRRNRQMLYNMWDTMGYKQENVWWHFLTPYSTHPASIYALNKIAVPPAMLFTMSEHIPRYLSLAKLGYNLAKAISYHFDYTGSNYNMYVSKHMASKKMDLLGCYDLNWLLGTPKYIEKVTQDNLMLSSNERFVEAMAINLISSMSHEDIQDYQLPWVSNNELAGSFSPEKIFFIALGQEYCKKPNLDEFFLHLFESEHPPPSLLLDITLSQSQLFPDVFSCKSGSNMNQEFKCEAFPEMQEMSEDDYDYFYS